MKRQLAFDKEEKVGNKPPAGQIRFSTCQGQDARKGSCEAPVPLGYRYRLPSKRVGSQIPHQPNYLLLLELWVFVPGNYNSI